MEPVQAGIFIGLRERSIFLRGNGPEDFKQIEASSHGARPNSGIDVSPDFFSANLVRDRDQPVAAWLSEVGLAVGRADGSIAYPQESRITVDGGISRPTFFRLGGVKQCAFSVEEMTVGLEPIVDQTI